MFITTATQHTIYLQKQMVRKEITLKIDLNNHEFSIVWDGVYYKALKNYPQISNWELQSIHDFIKYENQHDRDVEFNIGNTQLKKKILDSIENGISHVERPYKIEECTACKQKGCLTSYLCHTTSLESSIQIILSDQLLSAIKLNNKSNTVLLEESRNAANDPLDYFDHIMFSYGNCQAGDRLVVERKLGRLPEESDLSQHFIPGIRFYFKYDSLRKHPQAVFDGYHALKIKDSLTVSPYLYALIVPLQYKNDIEQILPPTFKNKVHYIENDCKDIWEWSEKVYNYIIEI